METQLHKHRSKSEERVAVERLVHGNLFGALPGIRDMAYTVRGEWESGLTEQEIRQRIRSRLETAGVTTRRILLPGLNRKMLRLKLRPLLIALVDHLVVKSPSKRVGTALDTLLGKIGYDQWLEDYIWTYATTGEAPAIFDAYTGRVFRNDFGPGDDRSTSVWLVATPASDVDALLEWFKEEARAAFPPETFAKRRGGALEGAQTYRWNKEGRTFAEIATENIADLYPDLFIADNDEEFLFCQKLIDKETERLKKLAERTARRGDIIQSYTSPVE